MAYAHSYNQCSWSMKVMGSVDEEILDGATRNRMDRTNTPVYSN